MKRYPPVSLFALGACLALTAACSSNGAGSANVAAPSSAAAAPVVNLSGSWSGKLGSDSSAPSLKWTAAQNGSSVSGPVSATFAGDNGSPQTIQGTMNGAMSGAQLSLTLSFPAGAFVDIPGCAVGGTGTATPTSSSISSTMVVTFAAPCIGTVSDRPTETDQLTLTKS